MEGRHRESIAGAVAGLKENSIEDPRLHIVGVDDTLASRRGSTLITRQR
jgi:hypothetical protein